MPHSIATAEVQFSYDRRDGSLSTSIAPLGVPPEIQHLWPLEIWMSFRGKEMPSHRESEKCAAQVARELGLLEQLMADTLGDPQAVRDGAYFCHGYQAAYNDFYSGRWDVGD